MYSTCRGRTHIEDVEELPCGGQLEGLGGECLGIVILRQKLQDIEEVDKQVVNRDRAIIYSHLHLRARINYHLMTYCYEFSDGSRLMGCEEGSQT